MDLFLFRSGKKLLCNSANKLLLFNFQLYDFKREYLRKTKYSNYKLLFLCRPKKYYNIFIYYFRFYTGDFLISPEE